MRPAALRFTCFAAAILAAWPAATRAADAAADAATEVAVPCETVMRIHGSPTIGAVLIQDLLRPFLSAEGWTELRKSPAAEGTSYTLMGRTPGSAKLAGVYVEISDPESALTALDQGFADIAMSSRRVRPAEARQLTRTGDLTSPKCEHVLALDGVAVIVNSANPIETLTRSQLKEIFLRHTVSWQEVGGSGPIHLYASDAKSGNGATFQTAILDDEEISPDARRLNENQTLADAVASDPRGIGFVGSTFVGTNRVIALSDGKAEARAVKPVANSIRNGEYLLARRLYLYAAERTENPLAQKFMDFATGRAGQAIVMQDGFVSATLEPAVPRESVASLASNPPVPPPTALPEARTNPPPAPTPSRVRTVEPRPAPTPRARPEPAAPKPTPTPPPPRPSVPRSRSAPSTPASTPDANSGGTGG